MTGRFFIMVCAKKTEAECLERNLFGGKLDYREWFKGIRHGDTGFLLNVESGDLLGVFEAMSQAQPNIEEPSCTFQDNRAVWCVRRKRS